MSKNVSQFLHSYFMINYFFNYITATSQLLHNYFLTCSWFAHDLFTTCSWFAHDLCTTCSWCVHNFFMNCSLNELLLTHLIKIRVCENIITTSTFLWYLVTINLYSLSTDDSSLTTALFSEWTQGEAPAANDKWQLARFSLCLLNCTFCCTVYTTCLDSYWSVR